MEFESVQKTAERLQVSVRSVQKWAKEGKLPGAKQVGRAWLIPSDASGPVSEENMQPEERTAYRTMRLLNCRFEPGHCMECINEIASEEERAIVLGEYYFYAAQPEKTVNTVELYLDHPNRAIRMVACMLYLFANLSLGHLHLSYYGKECLEKNIAEVFRENLPEEERADAIFNAKVASTLLHTELPAQFPSVESVLSYLPEGAKLFSVYIMAHDAYMKKEYDRALAMTDLALALYPGQYTIPMIYLHLIASVALINLKRAPEAKERFMKAWRLAQPDGLYEILGDHYGILQGVVDACLKKEQPDEFERIIQVIRKYSNNWLSFRNRKPEQSVAMHLTAQEFSIAMLFHRSWSVKEIAAHMDVSERIVKKHLSVIYEKLGISSRRELEQYLVQ